MSALVEKAIAAAGLDAIGEARRAGDFERVRDAAGTLRTADLLALGALADRVRAEEAGDVVRVYANAPPRDGTDVVAVAPQADGLAFLREVAVARITGPRAARVRVDWTLAGIEIAQVALGFGASELVGRIANKRGLVLAEDAMATSAKKSQALPAQLVKKREIAALIRRSGRIPELIDSAGRVESIEPHAEAHAGEGA
jgi:2-iminoacetate synthase ThiH